MTLIHIDAHSDLYRNRNKNLSRLSDTDMGCDDFIWYALREEFVNKLYWVVPDGLYNLADKKLALQFMDESMVLDSRTKAGRLEILFEVVTRYGSRQVEYTICELDQLPCFGEDIELVTVASSPEFVPEASDSEIFKAMMLLGATENDLARMEKIYKDML